MTIRGLDEYVFELEKLGAASVDIQKKAVYSGAKIVADRIRSELIRAIGESESSTGDLLESLGITPIDVDDRGNINAKIGFDGYDRKGEPNQLKARVLESGSSRQKKRPFVRPAVNATKDKARAEMGRVVDDEIKKIMK